jgi:hypothetical protein
MRLTLTLGLILISAAVLCAAPTPAAPWSIVFDGPQATEYGLQAVAASEVGHVVLTQPGVHYWSTDRHHGLYKLAVQAPPMIDARGPMPVTVTVNYLDAGHAQWALEYDAVNFKGEPWRTHSRVVQNQGSGQWKTASFFLCDAAPFSPPTGWWLAVDSFGEMPEQGDIGVRSISVSLGGLGVVASTPVAAPEEPVTFRVSARDAQGQPLPNVTANLRLGEGLLASGLGESGTADLTMAVRLATSEHVATVTVDKWHAEAPLLIWPGAGPAQIESTLVDTAQSPEPWVYWPDSAQVALGALDPEEGGSWLRYAFVGPYWPGYVDLTRRTYLRGMPLDMNLEVKGETGGARLAAILEDATGQRFCYPLGAVRWPEWTHVRGSLRGPTRYWGGASDGQPHYPLAFLSLRLLQGPSGSRTTGEVHVRNVFVRTLAP